MKRLVVLSLLIVGFSCGVQGQSSAKCADLQQAIKTTYNFKPSKLSAAQQTAKSAEMDAFWNTVKSNPKELAPCLRNALEAPDADQWFKFDGSVLLVVVDPSPDSKKIEARNLATIDFADIDPRVWVGTAIRLALEGFDVSEAGAHWLANPKEFYFLPEHGGFRVDNATAALFIYGSMDEAIATPALFKMVQQSGNPAREIAVALLVLQATPESLQAIKQIDQTGLSQRSRSMIKSVLEKPSLFQPRSNPKTTRDEFLTAFQKIVDGDFGPFFELTNKVHDGEKDVVTVMKPEDLPLIRRVRRRMIASGNQHSAEYYDSFTRVLMTLIRKTT